MYWLCLRCSQYWLYSLDDPPINIAFPIVARMKQHNAVLPRPLQNINPPILSPFAQSEISAKGDPARPGETLSRLLKGELGAEYEPAIGILWDTDGGGELCPRGF